MFDNGASQRLGLLIKSSVPFLLFSLQYIQRRLHYSIRGQGNTVDARPPQTKGSRFDDGKTGAVPESIWHDRQVFTRSAFSRRLLVMHFWYFFSQVCLMATATVPTFLENQRNDFTTLRASPGTAQLLII